MACCTSCKPGAPGCQINGCYHGWWCNIDTCKCQSPPAPCDGSTSAGSSGSGGGAGGSVSGTSGGKLDTLSFAIVGDTGPPVIDDTAGYPTFLSRVLTPIGGSTPSSTVSIGSTINAWTAKLVFIAANAWSSAQATWLSTELAKPTTYTFIVRHESKIANTAPGVTPSQAILAQHPPVQR